MLETRGSNGIQCFVDRLDAWDLMNPADLKVPPIMIYGDAVTQILTEKGIAHLHKCVTLGEREAAIKAVAGDTDLGKQAKPGETADLRCRKTANTGRPWDRRH